MSILPGGRVDPVEWEKLAARRDRAMARLAKLQADSEEPLWWNRAYPLDVVMPLFSGSASGGGYPASFGEFNTDSGSTFFALGIEAPYTVSGVLAEDGVTPATLTIPESMRPAIFDYTFGIRDSASDRDWMNTPIPSYVIRMGNLGMFGIGGQARLPGGTRVSITVNPVFFDAASASTGITTFSSHNLQFVLSGIAVKDGVL